jgi:hypothetical protein
MQSWQFEMLLLLFSDFETRFAKNLDVSAPEIAYYEISA